MKEYMESSLATWCIRHWQNTIYEATSVFAVRLRNMVLHDKHSFVRSRALIDSFHCTHIAQMCRVHSCSTVYIHSSPRPTVLYSHTSRMPPCPLSTLIPTPSSSSFHVYAFIKHNLHNTYNYVLYTCMFRI